MVGGVASSLQGSPTPVYPWRQVGQLGAWGATPARRPLEPMEGVIRGHERVWELAHHSADPSPYPAPVVLPFGEVLVVSWVDGPEVAFAVFAAACLDEAFVQGEVVSHTVSPILVL